MNPKTTNPRLRCSYWTFLRREPSCAYHVGPVHAIHPRPGGEGGLGSSGGQNLAVGWAEGTAGRAEDKRGREAGRQAGRQGGRQGAREAGRQGAREAGREGGRVGTGGRKEGRVQGREGTGGRKEGRVQGREGRERGRGQGGGTGRGGVSEGGVGHGRGGKEEGRGGGRKLGGGRMRQACPHPTCCSPAHPYLRIEQHARTLPAAPPPTPISEYWNSIPRRAMIPAMSMPASAHSWKKV